MIYVQIEFCLDQWVDGSLSNGARFTKKDYKPKYENHLRLIQAWMKIDPVVTERIRQQMYEEAQYVSYPALAINHTIHCVVLNSIFRQLG